MSKFFVGQRVRVVKTGLQGVVRKPSGGLVTVDFDDRDGEGYYWNDELEPCVCNEHDGDYWCETHSDPPVSMPNMEKLLREPSVFDRKPSSMDPEPMPELPPPPLAPAVVPAGYHDRKFDAGKSRMDLLPFEALEAVGDVLAYGCAKYAENSWQQVPDARKRYTAALLRHLAAMQRGEELDEESGHLHAVHMATNALFICWLEVNGRSK